MVEPAIGAKPQNGPKMQAVYYRRRNGYEPVREFVLQLTQRHQDAIDQTIELLNQVEADDPPLPFPLSSQVDGQLRELRCHHGRHLYRILYRRSENLFVLLNILEKRSRALPIADIGLANERWNDFRTRMDDPNRRPPRAAGHDAP